MSMEGQVTHVTKPEKVALCRACHGTGTVNSGKLFTKSTETCPQCHGSGRVLVSCEMTLRIRPYERV